MAKKNLSTELKTLSKKGWDKSKTKKAAGFVETDEGVFSCRCDEIIVDMNNDDNVYVQFNNYVVAGPDAGSRVFKRIVIEEFSKPYVDKKTNKKKTFEVTKQERMDEVAIALTKIGFDPSTFSDLKSALEAAKEYVEENSPGVRCKVKANGDFMNVLLVKFLDDEDLPELSNEEYEDDDEDDDESEESDDEDDESDDDEDDEESDDEDDEESDEEDEDEEDDDDEEDGPPCAKGDTVTAQPPKGKKGKYKVMSVNVGQETCTLKNIKTNTQFKSVPWDKISS